MRSYIHYNPARRASTAFYSGICLCILAAAANAQNNLPELLAAPTAEAGATPVALKTASPSADAISINIDGRSVEANPAPILKNGAVLVPLRGVLESLGAVVNYDVQSSRIDIAQGSSVVSLRVGQNSAVVALKTVPLSAAPQLFDNRAFVPLRSLAEIFGYTVNWVPASKTVAIITNPNAPKSYSDHRAALKAGGAFGIEVDFTDASPEETNLLLDAVKKAGAGIVKTRFDWNTLEPTKGAAFNWPAYDRVVRGARERNLIVVGILGNSTQWASIYPRAVTAEEWRNGPPRTSEMPAFSNYVKRVVGRYGNDVHAWQIWERTSSDKFRSGLNDYVKVYNIAAKAVRGVDPRAIIHTSEPGGVLLNYIESLNTSLPAPLLNGIALYPASGFQPGVPAAPEAFLRPFDTLRARPAGKGRDLWVGGLSWPVLGEPALPGAASSTTDVAPAAVPANAPVAPATVVPAAATTVTEGGVKTAAFEPVSTRSKPTTALTAIPGIAGADEATARRLVNTYTPEAQADYLTRSAALALAAGSEKVFWGSLRDGAGYERVEPINPEFSSGLLRRDFTPRASYAAYQTLTRQIGDKKYLGALSLGPDAVALVFDNGLEGSILAWGLSGKSTLTFNPEGADPQVTDSIFTTTRADSKVLDSMGQVIGGAGGAVALTPRPVWITKIAAGVATALKAQKAQPVALAERPVTWDPAVGVKATFDDSTPEQGLYWRSYRNFRSVAQRTVEYDGRGALSTEISGDIFNPAAGRFFIFLDVADEYMYFARGVPVEVTVEVRRPAPPTDTLVTTTAGFNIQYDSPTGFKYSKWQVVEPGEGWATYTFTLPDASFANNNGFDLMINTFGSKVNLAFGSVTVKKVEK